MVVVFSHSYRFNSTLPRPLCGFNGEECIFCYLLVHLSLSVNSSEPKKQFGVPSHNFDSSNSCRTSVDSLTWQPKYPSSRFRKKISCFIPNPIPPKDWAVWNKQRQLIITKKYGELCIDIFNCTFDYIIRIDDRSVGYDYHAQDGRKETRQGFLSILFN